MSGVMVKNRSKQKPSKDALIAALPESQSTILNLVSKGWELRDCHGATFYLLNRSASCQRQTLPVRSSVIRALSKKGLVVPGSRIESTTIWETV